MARIEQLVDLVADEPLRKEIAAEVAALKRRQQFGLVFERHIPETTLLLNAPIKVGSTVVKRKNHNDTQYTVVEIRGDELLVAAQTTVEAPARQKAMERPTQAEAVARADVLVKKAFHETIYPALTSLGRVARGGDKPYHAVIEGENFHALELLVFALEGQVDCIYIDPPYNTGSHDWKYNNDYVDSKDAFRHSKWLSFMEKRLRLAKRILNPDDSVLVVTIDDNELFTLGLLVDQLFPNCERQTVSITISPRGKSRDRRLSQVDEYLLVVYLGTAGVADLSGGGEDSEVRWRYLRRNDVESARGTVKGGPNQFYPIYVDASTHRIVRIGEPLKPGESLDEVPSVPGATPVYPIREDGLHMNWGLTGPSLQRALADGFVRVTGAAHAGQAYTFAYLTEPNIKKVERGLLNIVGTRDDGSKIVVTPGGKESRSTTAWRDTRYDAGAYGTGLIRNLLLDRRFPFPKSLYAVEDTLRLFVKDKPHAVVLDFFSGSGTTAHAIARLNRQDGGHRRSILVTNNEVSEDEAAELRKAGVYPGDDEWESRGIFKHITRPRIEAAITGTTHDGQKVKGDYKFTDEFPMADGFEENVEFLRLDYLDPLEVELGMRFAELLPTLWLSAGGRGTQAGIDLTADFSVATDGPYALLSRPSGVEGLLAALEKRTDVTHVFVLTDSEDAFAELAEQLPQGLAIRMLPRDYLRSFPSSREAAG